MSAPTRDLVDGVLLAATSISGEGEDQRYGEFVVTLEEGTIDVRLGDRKDTIWMVDLERIEAALRLLKRAERARLASREAQL